MDLEELRKDIDERYQLLERLDSSHPLYEIMYAKLLEREEKYRLMEHSLGKHRISPSSKVSLDSYSQGDRQ